MSNKKHLALLLAAVVVGFGSMAGSTPARADLATAKAAKASKPGRPFPTVVLHDGGGMQCIPGVGCGFR